MRGQVQVLAVVRVDLFLDASDGRRVTVKEVLPTLEEAQDEVERLNRANGDKDCRYFWQATRWFPNGRNRRPRPAR